MLNISPNNKNEIDENQFVAYQKVNQEVSAPKLRRALYIIGGLVLLIMLLPWTQNIRSNGKITTLRPEQRPQTINSIIAGRIETWFVKEGDFVNKGDTIVVISEVKDGYFDPQLINRTQQQIKNKELSVVSYEQKVSALDQRIDALIETSQLKLQQAKIKYRQARLKITADSIEFQAAETNYDIAKDQLTRFEKLLNQGLKSQTEVETRRMAMQRAQTSIQSEFTRYLGSRYG